MDNDLKPCPFCGSLPKWWSCDRLIQITCEKCKYTRSFPGIVGTKKTKVPIVYTDGKVSETEFYNQFAYEEAIAAWNRRANDDRD